MERIQTPLILKDLAKKMVILAGPRQVGKTYLAKEVAKHYANSVYLNYDHFEDRKIMQEASWLPTTDLLILDELHKMLNWKNYLKGIYDTKPEKLHILVTGSAHLETFDRIGDSLAGRYFLHRLMPFSSAELHQIGAMVDIQTLLTRGGFPEPLLAETEIDASRWRQQYSNSILSTDIFELDEIQNLNALKIIFELLRARVGSPISFSSLAQDAAVAPNTVRKYIALLEALYVIFRVTPFSKNIARSLLKEPKIYFFDTGLVSGTEGAKLENLVALSLLSYCYGRNDYLAENNSLHYLKTKEGHEVDFALAKDNSIKKIIEVKNSDSSLSKHLYSYHKKYGFPAIQIVKNLRHEKQVEGIQITKASNFLIDLTYEN